MSGFYVIVVGHDQQAKCQLLNAMSRQRDLFKQFSCRRRPVVKAVKNVTISGFIMNLVQTPSISTPAWAKVEKIFQEDSHWSTRNRIFIYVKTVPVIVDDVSSMEYLKNKFGDKTIRGVVCSCQDSNESSEHIANEQLFRYMFQLDADFQLKIEQSNCILNDIMKPHLGSTEASQVGSDRYHVTQRHSARLPPNQESLTEQFSSVNVDGHRLKVSEGAPTTEKKITQEDWFLFQRALQYGVARSNHTRVNVIGNHGVGKTTLIKRLLMQEVQCPDPKQCPTENLEVHHLIARCVEKNGEKVWEYADTGLFLEDLNIQRMAQAFIETAKLPVSQHNVTQELEMGSEIVEETSLPTSTDHTSEKVSPPYTNLYVLKEKETYLRKIIYCKDMLENENLEKQYVSYWDFAGQATYYSTHQLFMSPSAVYLLVIDLRKDLKDVISDNLLFRAGVLQSCTVQDCMNYWIHHVQAYTKDENGGHAPIIIVGTHRNDIADTKQIEKKFDDIRKLFSTNFECIALDSSTPLHKDKGLNILRSKLIDNSMGLMDKEITSQWINLEYDMQMSSLFQKSYLKFSDLQNLDKKMDRPMGDAGRLEAFLCYQHHKGKLLFYHHQDLKDLIITDPMLMVSFLNRLLRRQDSGLATFQKGWNQDGILNLEYIEGVAKELGIEDFAWMVILKILVKLNILHPMSTGNADGTVTDKYFLPFLLKAVPVQDHDDTDKCTRSSLFEVRFNYDMIHQSTYQRIVCSMMKTMTLIEVDGEKLVYNHLAIFGLQGSEFMWLTLYWEHSKIYFHVKDFNSIDKKPMNQYIDEVIEFLKDAIENVLTINQQENIEFSFWIECPKHTGSFVSVKQLEEKKQAMCYGHKDGRKTGIHAVNISEISSITKRHTDEEKEDPHMKEKPSDKVLSRLAWKLKEIGKETPAHLAIRLKLSNSFIKADLAARDYSEPGTELFIILIHWRNQNRGRTNSWLVKRLCSSKDYDLRTLTDAMFHPAIPDLPLINFPTYATTEDRDITIISDHIGNGFTFVLIELDVDIALIEQEKRNHMDDTQGMIRQLLCTWRKKNPTKATTAILKAMSMFGLPVDQIITKLNDLAKR